MSDILLPAISLWQPWAWLLVHGHEHPNGKRVENRTWPLPAQHIGKWRLIHASKNLHFGTLDFDREEQYAVRYAKLAGLPNRCPQDMYYNPPWQRKDLDFGGIIGAVKWGQATALYPANAWQILTMWHWPTTAARPLPFVPWRGSQGFFRVPLGALPAEYQWLKEFAA